MNIKMINSVTLANSVPRRFCPFFIKNGLKCSIEFFSTARSKIMPELEKEVEDGLDSNDFKHRKHPGALRNPCHELPPKIKKAILTVMKDTPKKQLIADAEVLSKYLHTRHLPMEIGDFKEKKNDIRAEVIKTLNLNYENISEEQKEQNRKIIKSKVEFILKQRVYNWQSIDFTHHKSLVYMTARAAPEFAVVTQILSEIKKRNPNFEPRTLFDFGSGVGTVLWASHYLWPNSFTERFCVDASGIMCELSKEIIEELNWKDSHNIFYRQFLPSKLDTYDLVVSSYSLFELPNKKARQDVFTNLWNRTKHFMILVEFGTKAGFKVLDEAREYILELSKQNKDLEGYIFSPCPHDLPCPRKMEDNTPCNFQATFLTYPQNTLIKKELYSFLIFAKGVNTEENWPRIVRPILNRSRHAICRMCTPTGKLTEVIFSPAKSGKNAYKCAKASRWGDRLPISFKDEPEEESKEEPKDESKDESKEEPKDESKEEPKDESKEK